jgi:hypothetical protein
VWVRVRIMVTNDLSNGRLVQGHSV